RSLALLAFACLAAAVSERALSAQAQVPAPASSEAAGPSVGSKNFTESILLADLLQLQAQRAHLSLAHRRAMGGSAILWQALLSGSIDVYPEYTGTLTQQFLRDLPSPVSAR